MANNETFSIGLNLNDLKQFVNAAKDQLQAAVRPAAQAGAQVIYDAAKSNAERVKKTGNLSNAVYQAYSPERSGDLKATYNVSWNHTKAPHGRLVEWGHIQRYKVYVGSDGNWHTAVRKAMQNKPKPKRKASQAVKDAYYVPLPSPRYVPAVPFMRAAIASHSGKAIEAMAAEFAKRLGNVA